MKFILSISLCLSLVRTANGQGCSDAGFCTIGSMNVHEADTSKKSKHKLSALLGNGIGDQSVFVFTPGIQYEYEANDRVSFQTKFTGNYAQGDLGTAAGLGDLFLSSTYNLSSKKKTKHAFTLGTKLPLNLGDIKYNNKPLPMQYQSSLGTVDVIVGYKMRLKKISANVAWQQPLTGRNRNTFLPQYIGTMAAFGYPPSNDFNRRGDVLLRLAYEIISKDKLKWNASVLSIYHLKEDTYIDANVSTMPINISGSSGLTINITSMLSFKINSKFTVALSGGVPLIVRAVRPDGLTRAIALIPEISYSF